MKLGEPCRTSLNDAVVRPPLLQQKRTHALQKLVPQSTLYGSGLLAARGKTSHDTLMNHLRNGGKEKFAGNEKNASAASIFVRSTQDRFMIQRYAGAATALYLSNAQFIVRPKRSQQARPFATALLKFQLCFTLAFLPIACFSLSQFFSRKIISLHKIPSLVYFPFSSTQLFNSNNPIDVLTQSHRQRRSLVR
ncbi:unnamed protein product [Amoebophrya sp. A120]|nr:unnamed protein product [Amoebophrya sp. A120]|eukprot:GSA120T00017148001.1